MKAPLNLLFIGVGVGFSREFSDENQMVSGGQKQLIGIARALNRSGEVLILDESTSAMDADLEREILNEVFNSSFKTIIAVSHKPYLLKKFDKIVLFNDGKIIDYGDFNYLIKMFHSTFTIINQILQ